MAKSDQGKAAYLYVVSDGSGAHKVGLSTSPRRRLSHLQSGSSRRLSLVRESPAQVVNAAAVEAYAHWLLREAHIFGEWFRVTEDAAWVALVAAQKAVEGGATVPKKQSSHGRPGRPKLWAQAMIARFTAGTFARISSVLGPGEVRTDFVRLAVERELARLEQSVVKKQAKEDA